MEHDQGGRDMKRNIGLYGLSLTFLIAGIMAAGTPALAQGAGKGGLDQTGPYSVVAGWFKPGVDRWDQPVAAVAVDNPNRIFIANSDQVRTQPNAPMLSADGKVLEERSNMSEVPNSEKPHLHQIMVLNSSGEVIEDWSQWDDMFIFPHNMEINPYDPNRHLWVVDRDGQQIHKFTNDGKELVMTLGEKGVTGSDENHFNMPAALAFMPDGSFYVADGYVNSRIVKFDKDGSYLFEWGTKGSDPGQFDLVHSITIDANKRIYASDRRNNRIQVFDEHGKFLDQWPNVGSPTRVVITEDQALWMAEANHDRIVKFNLNGELQTYWGVTGDEPGAMDNPHSFALDQDGNLYIADAWNNRVQKFVPSDNADKARLVAQEFRFETP
jgi:peptidylamidoglycolate lyase